MYNAVTILLWPVHAVHATIIHVYAFSYSCPHPACPMSPYSLHPVHRSMGKCETICLPMLGMLSNPEPDLLRLAPLACTLLLAHTATSSPHGSCKCEHQQGEVYGLVRSACARRRWPSANILTHQAAQKTRSPYPNCT